VLSVKTNFVNEGVAYEESTRGEPYEGEDRDDVNFLTVAVTPQDAQLLWLVSQEGALTVALRAFGDDAIANLDAVVEPIPLP
jgi:hypothetical protein